MGDFEILVVEDIVIDGAKRTNLLHVQRMRSFDLKVTSVQQMVTFWKSRGC